MQASDFKEPFPGVLTSTVGGLLAFVPTALPDSLDLPPRVLIQASEAERAIGRLGGLLEGGGNPLNPHLVARPLQQREAIESSRIEGTFTTPEQLILFESESDDDTDTESRGDTREVQSRLPVFSPSSSCRFK